MQIRIIKLLLRTKNFTQKQIAEKVKCDPSYITQVKAKANTLGYLTYDGKGTNKWDDLYNEKFTNSNGG